MQLHTEFIFNTENDGSDWIQYNSGLPIIHDMNRNWTGPVVSKPVFNHSHEKVATYPNLKNSRFTLKHHTPHQQILSALPMVLVTAHSSFVSLILKTPSTSPSYFQELPLTTHCITDVKTPSTSPSYFQELLLTTDTTRNSTFANCSVTNRFGTLQRIPHHLKITKSMITHILLPSIWMTCRFALITLDMLRFVFVITLHT